MRYFSIKKVKPIREFSQTRQSLQSPDKSVCVTVRYAVIVILWSFNVKAFALPVTRYGQIKEVWADARFNNYTDMRPFKCYVTVFPGYLTPPPPHSADNVGP